MFRKNPRLATAYWNIVRTHGLESESSRAAAVAADAAAVAAVGDSRTLETATRGGSLHLRRCRDLAARRRAAPRALRQAAARGRSVPAHGGADGVYRLRAEDLPPQALLQRPGCLWAVISLARAGRAPPRRTTRTGRRAADRTHRPRGGSRRGARRAEGFRRRDQGCVGSRERRRPRGSSRSQTTTPTDPDDVEDILLGGARENSYPPPVPCSDDDDELNDDDVPGRDPLHALPVAHLLAVSVVPLLAEPAVAGDALLVLQETLPLLELTPADRGDDADAAAVVDVEAVATRLGTYATAMERALATASAGASASGEDELLPTGECPAFFPALAMTAVMLAAAGADAAAIATRRGTIPARLVTRVETAAIDELLAAAVPGLRKVTLAALDVLGRPSSGRGARRRSRRARDARREVAARDDAAAAASRPRATPRG